MVEMASGSSLVIQVHGTSVEIQARANHNECTVSSGGLQRPLTQGKLHMQYAGHTRTCNTRDDWTEPVVVDSRPVSLDFGLSGAWACEG